MKKRSELFKQLKKETTFNDNNIFQKEFWSKNFKCILLFTFFVITYCLYFKEQLHCLFYLIFGDYCELLYSFLNSYSVIKYILAILILYAGFLSAKKLYYNHYKALWHIFLPVILLLILWSDSNTEFCVIAGPIFNFNTTFKHVLSLSFSLPLIVYLIKLGYWIINFYKTFNNKNNSNQNRHSFTTDEITTSPEDQVRYKFAESIVNQLKGLDISKESYVIGITGYWGSGKSTFLENMKSFLKDDNYIINYNPWNCISSEQVVRDFFNLLSDKLGVIYSPISPVIMKYARLLISMDLNGFEKAIEQFLPDFDDSFDSQKTKINEFMNHIDKPIVITIDDLDRLKSNEIFEVLRLIRNTAKFHNIIYIITLDKKYVSEQLKQKGIEDGCLYLEKIISLEIPLTKIDSTDLISEFKAECRKMISNITIANRLLNKLDTDEIDILTYYLSTYRKVKRFTSFFSSRVNFLLSQKSHIDLYDFLFLELIHSVYPELYEKLEKQYFSILDLNYHEKLKIPYYTIKESRFVSDENDYNKQMKVRLLKVLFNNNSIKKTRLQAVDNYEDFFILGLPQEKVSEEKFENMLSMSPSIVATEGMKTIFSSWCNGKVRMRQSSIYTKFVTCNLDYNGNEKNEKVIIACCYWLYNEFKPTMFIYNAFLKILSKKNFNEDNHDRFKRQLVKYLTEVINNKNNISFAYTLSNLIQKGKDDLILSTDEMKYLLWENMLYVLESQEWDACNIVINDGNKLNSVMMHSAFVSGKDSNEDVWINPVIEKTIEWLKEKNYISSHLSEVISRYNDVVDKNRIGTYSQSEQLKEKRIIFNKIFGYNGFIMYSSYINSCFKSL